MYTAQFERSGFRGPINWYRNFDRNWERTAQLAGQEDRAAGAVHRRRARSGAVVLGRPARAHAAPCADLRGSLLLPDAGHWVQQEQPETVNAALLEFLERLG